MPVEVIMPKVDMDMTHGTIGTWHVAEGHAVAKGDALFEIETDKAAMEVDAPASGVLRDVVATVGERIAVGARVAWIYAEGEAVEPGPSADSGGTTRLQAAEPETEVHLGTSPPVVVTAGTGEAAPGAGRLRATPAARHAARTAGLPLSQLAGTGPNGRIQQADVLAASHEAMPPAGSLAPAAPGTLAENAAHASVRQIVHSAGELQVTSRGGVGTPLLLIHGFAADSTGWRPLERALSADLPLVRFDLPCHGGSPGRNIGTFRDLVRPLIESFDRTVDGQVHLLGHSLGGAVALALADVRPRQVASLTLVAPAGLGPEIDASALAGIARASRVESLAPWLKRLTGMPDTLGWDFVRAAMAARAEPELRAAQIELLDTLFPDGVQSFDLTAALGRVVAPTAIIWGRKDRIIPWRHALEASGEMALHLLPGIGHIPHVERPEAVAAILRRQIASAG